LRDSLALKPSKDNLLRLARMHSRARLKQVVPLSNLHRDSTDCEC